MSQQEEEIRYAIKCPKHDDEKAMRICAHPHCNRTPLLCGECLFDDQEHAILHKNYMKTIKDFVESVAGYYSQKKQKKYSTHEIPPKLMDFFKDHNRMKEAFAERFVETVQIIDIVFEKCIKSFMDSISLLRNETRAKVKENFELLSQNYESAVEQIKSSYNLFSSEEHARLYPDEFWIKHAFKKAKSYNKDLEEIITRAKQDVFSETEYLRNNSNSPEKEIAEKIKTKEDLINLVNIIKLQISQNERNLVENTPLLEGKVHSIGELCLFEAKNLEAQIVKGFHIGSVEDYQNRIDDDDENNEEEEEKDSIIQGGDIQVYQHIRDIEEEELPKYLYFFKQNSHYLNLLDLSVFTESLPGEVKFERILLDNNFRIPHDHASICLPNGSIYLTGGTDSYQHFKDFFKYSVATNAWVRLPSMQKKRSAHCICYLQNAIYVIGGYDGTRFLRDCEVYDLGLQSWASIGSLNVPSAFASACSFNDRYIFKFGGLNGKDHQYINIYERYSLINNVWDVVELKTQDPLIRESYTLRESAESIQINSKQIIIFGGKNKNTTLDSTLLLDVDELEVSIKVHPQAKLPFAEYFRCPKSITMKKGQVYVVSFYMRKIFGFDGTDWLTLG